MISHVKVPSRFYTAYIQIPIWSQLGKALERERELIIILFLSSQDQQQDIKPNIISHDSQTELPNNATEAAIPDSGSVSASSNDNRKVSREDIELVRL